MASAQLTLHSIIYTICLCFILSKAQDAFVVDFAADPSDVPLGDKVNLTCTFALDKNTLKEGEVTENGNSLFTFTATPPSGPPDGVADFGYFLPEDASTGSGMVWATVKASLCEDKATDRNYECKVTNQNDESVTKTATATYSGDAASETCGTPDPDASNSTDAAGVYTTPPPTPKGNGTTDGLDYQNIGMYGSAIALIIILITAAILGLIGLWYCMLVKQGRAKP